MEMSSIVVGEASQIVTMMVTSWITFWLFEAWLYYKEDRYEAKGSKNFGDPKKPYCTVVSSEVGTALGNWSSSSDADVTKVVIIVEVAVIRKLRH